MPSKVYYCRLNDPAQSFNKTDALRFSPKNPYDCFIYFFPALFTFELKSTKGTLITFWREDFEDKTKKQTFMIKKNQVLGLNKSNQSMGIISGFILNFRKTNHTYFLHIEDFNDMVRDLDKKSFNENDVVNNGGYLIEQKLKRVKYTYNIEGFVKEMQKKYKLT